MPEKIPSGETPETISSEGKVKKFWDRREEILKLGANLLTNEDFVASTPVPEEFITTSLIPEDQQVVLNSQDWVRPVYTKLAQSMGIDEPSDTDLYLIMSYIKELHNARTNLK
ncbi:MAG: hypothetical protein V1846_01260 [Candidatus Komeilibacteria bacterium]